MLRSALLALLLVALPSPAWTAAAGWEPWPKPVAKRIEPGVPSSQTWLLLWLVRFYQVGISPADGAGCTYYPTCSGYALQALRKHGPVLGFILTAERTNRNHSNQDGYFPQINKWGRVWLWDPVDNNDFWFHDHRRSGPDIFSHPELKTEVFWNYY